MTTSPLKLEPDRFFPAEKNVRAIAQILYQEIANLPIISPHGHTDPSWFAENTSFKDAHEVFVKPDHYLIRMLYSQGISFAELGIPSMQREPVASSRAAWRTFAKHFYLFRATPTGHWLNQTFFELFGIRVRLNESSADHYYDTITEQLQSDEFRARPLFDRFNIEFLSTTESPLDSLEHHQTIINSSWGGHVVTSYRPDTVIDPDNKQFASALKQFSELTNEDLGSWDSYLKAHIKRRAFFASLGATSTDHGHPTARTANLSNVDAEKLYQLILSGKFDANDAELFRAQMLTEMAKMSIDDGMVMQIHPGSYRNHNQSLFDHYGRDKGADIPVKIEFTHALKPLLDCVGNDKNLKIILFTLDESTYSRELAPLAGHYPCLALGPAWWFHDSPAGMMKFREQTYGTAGFYNTVGFNDDTRAFLSVPVRHDMARRIDCAFLSKLVAEHQLHIDEALIVAKDLTYNLPKQAYRLA